MQEDEEYGNIVWDKHFGNNYKILQKQKEIYQKSGFFNPFASLQSLSMGFCGTDMFHHLDFLKESEEYRRTLIKALNNEHAFGGAKTGDWKWTVNNTFFKSIEDFSYRNPKISDFLSHYLMDLLCLLWWSIITTILIKSRTNKELLI
jgi:ABC-2 type transport system permease protein